MTEYPGEIVENNIQNVTIFFVQLSIRDAFLTLERVVGLLRKERL